MSPLFEDSYAVVEVVPLAPMDQAYSYLCPKDILPSNPVGYRCVMEFGSRILTGVVLAERHYNPDKDSGLKPIIDFLDDSPSFHPPQLKLMEWMAGYYMAKLGEVFNVALPSALKINSETLVTVNEEFSLDSLNLNAFEFELIEAIKLKPNTKAADLKKSFKQGNTIKTLNSLKRRGIVQFEAELSEKYRPKRVKLIHINEEVLAEKISEISDKQRFIIIELQRLEAELTEVSKTVLLKVEGISASSLQTLIKKDILFEEDKYVSRFPTDLPTIPLNELTDNQQEALEKLKQEFKDKDTALLHGITGSGKTEIYQHLIAETIANGGQVLYLVPEIGLTKQMVRRVARYFGSLTGVYHSAVSDAERAEVFIQTAAGKLKVIVGVRSSIFLPFNNLQLIIVDEEQDSSYKQQEPAPRYHARDCAIMLARFTGAKVVLGSATPSIEAKFLADTGKWAYVALDSRFNDAELPEIELLNLKNFKSENQAEIVLNFIVENALVDNYNSGYQALVLHNRRGYSNYMQCNTCSHTMKCKDCDVSLTYHFTDHKLHCHYCSNKYHQPQNCPDCGIGSLEKRGMGTQKYEELLQLLRIPFRVIRVDQDTARKKMLMDEIIDKLNSKELDILVGTQLISKGFDFENIQLVVVPEADRQLFVPDYRATEKCFQMLVQVAGRAGRRHKGGKVIIETYQPEHPVYEWVKGQDYHGFYKMEILERRNFNYPPFCKLIEIVSKGKHELSGLELLGKIKQSILKNLPSVTVLGPEANSVSRVNNLYLHKLLIKIFPNSGNNMAIKKSLLKIVEQEERLMKSKKVSLSINVDPY